MGFGIKIMPGVRVRVSSRGIRTSIGPRMARIHVGAGRTGFSSGVGPFTYSSVGGSRRRRPGTSTQYGNSESVSLAQLAKMTEADQIQKLIDRLTKVHLEEFEPVYVMEAGRIPTPSIFYLREMYFAQLKNQARFFEFKKRRQLYQEAIALSVAEKERLEAEQEVFHKNAQELLDADWDALVTNNPDSVFMQLVDAFGDNQATASPISVHDNEVDILMVVPDSGLIPDRSYGYTPAGRLSVRQMKTTERKEIYFDLVFSNAIATLKETFAVAPGIEYANLVVVRNTANKRLLKETLECIVFSKVSRELLQNASMDESPYSIMSESADSLTCDVTQNLDFKSLPLAKEKAIQDLISTVTAKD